VLPGEIVLIDETILMTPKPDESAPARTLSYLMNLQKVTALTVFHEELPGLAFTSSGQPCLLIVPPSLLVNAPESNNIGGRKFNVQPDARTPLKELGLSVSLVHVKSE